MKKLILVPLALLAVSCSKNFEKGSFGYDLKFLKEHKTSVVLQTSNSSGKIVIVPDYQARVMTSTSQGDTGKSYGWINYDLIKSGEIQKQINAFGGEERIWLGPEGGQYSIFFEEGKSFDIQNWQTPASLDTEPFDLVSQTDKKAIFRKNLALTNKSGFTFKTELEREVSILERSEIEKNLSAPLANNVFSVGYQSSNTLKNTGDRAWKKETGLLSIWILGMLNPSPETTIIMPFKDSLMLNTAYFGEVDKDRLTITDNTVLFKGGGKYRSKIGLPVENAMPIIGSFDEANNILTIVQYTLSENGDYVNSLWKTQEKPYSGDVVNAYNDGPMENGSQLGPFYELESSSAARELQPDESINHVHKTYHFEGSFEDLNEISKKTLNFDLNGISFK